MDLRRAALISAITLSLVRGHWVVGPVQAMAAMPFRWIYVVQLVGNSLFLLPLPLLLAAIYGTDAELQLSKNLRYVALTTCLVQGVLLTAPRVYAWAIEIQRNATNIRLFGRTTTGANLSGWLQTPDSSRLLWSSLSISSELAFIVFLFFLFRPAIEPSGPPTRTRPLLRTAARIAVTAGVLALTVNIGEQIYAATEFGAQASQSVWPNTMTRGQLILRNALAGLPYLCWAAAPWIAFRALTPR